MINSKIRATFLCTISIASILIFSQEPIEMKKEIISTENAPKAIGPYSQAVKAGNFMFISGQIPLDPKTCLLYTSPSPRDGLLSRMPSSA